MTYDAIGNMLTRGGTTYTWTQGRRLSGVENGKSIKYLYDNIGARVKKTVDNTVTEYQWAGDLLLSEKTDGRIIWYCYDSTFTHIPVSRVLASLALHTKPRKVISASQQVMAIRPGTK